LSLAINTSTHDFSVCVQYPPTPANYGLTEYLHLVKRLVAVNDVARHQMAEDLREERLESGAAFGEQSV